MPGSVAHALLDDRVLAPVASWVVDRYGPQVLGALGVRAMPVVVTVSDQVADPGSVDPDGDDDAALVAQGLDGWGEYLQLLADRLGPGSWVGDLQAVADLDAVAEDAWPRLLAALAADRELRAALVDPVRGEQGEQAPSYTAWWLRTHGPLGLDGPFALVDDVLGGLLPPAPVVLAGLDATVCRARGGSGAAEELDLDSWSVLLDPLAGQRLEMDVAVRVWHALAAPGRATSSAGRRPAVLPALTGPDTVELVAAGRVAVADAPMWCQRTDLGPLWPAPAGAGVARLLDVPLASDLADGQVDGDGEVCPVPPAVAELLGRALATWVEHEELWVDGEPVDWWVDDEGVPHAVHLAGLAAALAQAEGCWQRRWELEAVLLDPERAAEAVRDQAFAD